MGYLLSNHKMTMYAKYFGGMTPWQRLWPNCEVLVV